MMFSSRRGGKGQSERAGRGRKHGWVLVAGGEGRWRWVARSGACAPLPLVASILREMKKIVVSGAEES